MIPLEEILSDLNILRWATTKQRQDLNDPLRYPANKDEAEDKVSDVLWEHLRSRAKVYHSGGLGYLLFDDGVPVAVSEHDVRFAALLNQYGLKQGNKTTPKVGKHVGMMCRSEGTAVDLHLTSHYDEPTSTVYITEQPGWLVRITKDSCTRVPNGTDGQVFLFPADYVGWDFCPERTLPPTGIFSDKYVSDLLDELLFSGVTFKQSPLTDAEVRSLIILYIVTIFMKGVINDRPILTSLGPTGCGKTHFLRVIGRLVQSPTFDVSDLTDDPREVENQLVNNPFVAFDDPNGVSSKVLSLIKKSVTGGKAQRREYYTTFGQVEMPYRAIIALSTVEQPFRNEEEVNRQLAFSMEPRTDFTPDKRLLAKINQERCYFLTQFCERIELVLTALSEDADFTYVGKMRLAGFAELYVKLRRYDAVVGIESPVKRAAAKDAETRDATDTLNRWKIQQEQEIFVNNDLADAITKWKESETFNPDTDYTATELLRRLTPFVAGKPWWADSSEKLGRLLKKSKGAYLQAFGLVFNYDKHTKAARYSFTGTKTYHESPLMSEFCGSSGSNAGV